MTNIYARVLDGVVAEVLTLPDRISITEAMHPDVAARFKCCEASVKAGWIYDGKKFSPPVTIEPESLPIPTITPRQLRLWLLSRGLLSQVPTLIESMPEPKKSIAQIEWEFATIFEYGHQFIQLLGDTLGFSDDDIKAGFREAMLL